MVNPVDRMRPFAIGDPLPDGVTVLEASAGTGKTYAITALAVRYLADGRSPDELLIITFTKAATGELRGRLRGALVAARDALEGPASPQDSDLVTCLRDAPPEVVALRRTRLEAAVARFDALTVATTHSFCSQMLRGLGIAADVDVAATMEPDLELLVDQVVDDAYVAEFAAHAGPPAFDHTTARMIGRAAALSHPAADLPSYAHPPVEIADRRVAFAARIRAEVAHRKRAAGVMTYDDLQDRLCEVLSAPDSGSQVAGELARRFTVVLIDEFQDTDPVQYRIVHRAFIAGGSTVVMIGDPKQAIYGFRGADVQTYLRAARAAPDRRSMNTSWRSDAGLLRGLDALFGHARLGHPEIVYRPLAPAPEPQTSAPEGLPDRAPLRVRIVDRGALAPSDLGRKKHDPPILADPARRVVAEDLAADIVRLLAEHPEVKPRHIAVLVRKHNHAVLVQKALRSARVPVVINRVGSVFDTPVAAEWLRLLEAIERPSSRTAVAAAALTLFCGWDAATLAAADDVAWERLHETIAAWGSVMRRHGVAAMLAAVAGADDLVARVLARPEGERELTDLRHVAELLQAAAGQLRAGGLTTWLAEQIRTAAGDGDRDERARRLDSDAEAVQVVTVHGAKGLEFPVVYCPYLWEEGWIPGPGHASAYPVVHTAHGARRVAVGGPTAPDFADDWERSRDEQRGEELRLLYVALTRARHQVVVWWAGASSAPDSPLGRLLFAQDADGSIACTGGPLPADADVAERLRACAAAAPGAIAVEWAPSSVGRYRADVPAVQAALEANVLERRLDTGWRRWSYSGITASAHAPGESGTGDVRSAADDERAAPAADGGVAPDGFRTRELPLGGMPAGAAVGSLIHDALEHTDFAADDLPGELARAVRASGARHRVAIGEVDEVAGGLAVALATPLGGPFGPLALAGVPHTHRLDELAFELPVAATSSPRSVPVSRLAEIVGAHVSAPDPMARYAADLARGGIGAVRLRGFLNGFIDLVVRLPDGGFAVVDYKTNRLGPPGRLPTAWDYRPEAIVTAMHEADYPLQALLYLVALHRFLRWRLADYDPDRHLRGAGYLFLRGMLGPEAPVWDGAPCGIWTWEPPRGLIAALSDACEEGET